MKWIKKWIKNWLRSVIAMLSAIAIAVLAVVYAFLDEELFMIGAAFCSYVMMFILLLLIAVANVPKKEKDNDDR